MLWAGWHTTASREGEVSRVVIPTIYGTSFIGLNIRNSPNIGFISGCTSRINIARVSSNARTRKQLIYEVITFFRFSCRNCVAGPPEAQDIAVSCPVVGGAVSSLTVPSLRVTGESFQSVYTNIPCYNPKALLCQHMKYDLTLEKIADWLTSWWVLIGLFLELLL
jgi:hypothetical protein